jgi:hypothetical protein
MPVPITTFMANLLHPDEKLRASWRTYALLRDQVDAGLVALATRTMMVNGLDNAQIDDPELKFLLEQCFLDLEKCRSLEALHGEGAALDPEHHVSRALLESSESMGVCLLPLGWETAMQRYNGGERPV